MLKKSYHQFSLRTGVLIVSWYILIHSSVSALLILETVLSGSMEESIGIYFKEFVDFYLGLILNVQTTVVNASNNCSSYYMAWYMVGIIASVLAILALKKNKANFLTGIFLYLLGHIIINMVEMTVVVEKTWVMNEDPERWQNRYCFISWGPTAVENASYAIALMVLTAISAYFVCVVKKCQDTMMQNQSIVNQWNKPTAPNAI